MPHIKIETWMPRQACGMFYPQKKFIARVYDDAGKFLAETGKCTTKRGARMAGHRKLETLGL